MKKLFWIAWPAAFPINRLFLTYLIFTFLFPLHSYPADSQTRKITGSICDLDESCALCMTVEGAFRIPLKDLPEGIKNIRLYDAVKFLIEKKNNNSWQYVRVLKYMPQPNWKKN